VRAAHTDGFNVSAFTKLDCAPSAGGHLCGFSVRIVVVTGELERTMMGRFYAGPHGLVFESADATHAGA
jgi:hypothetical protein